MVGKPWAEPPLGGSSPPGSQPLSRAKNLPGFGNCRAMTIQASEEKPSEAVIQKVFDELPVP
jgi:hypothetical protein